MRSIFLGWRCSWCWNSWFFKLFLFYLGRITTNIKLIRLRRMVPENLRDYWKYCFCGLQSVSCSFRVKTWHYYFALSAAAWTFSVQVYWLSLLHVVLSFWSSVPGRGSVGCLVSKIAFLCGVVCFFTCLKEWIIIFLAFSAPLLFM